MKPDQYSLSSFADQELVARKFATKFVNKYWQETIFLSVPNSISNTYSNKLKATGMSVYQNEYKHFLLEFSKALIKGRIHASMDDIQLLPNTKINTAYIKYVWRKGFNFSSPRYFLNVFSSLNSNYFPNKLQTILINKLKYSQFPIFTIINGFNQIILAESSEEIIVKKSLVDKMYQWYNRYSISNKDVMPHYEGLFFINPDDALEYQEYIKQKYVNATKEHRLQIFASRLDIYYKLIRNSIQNENVQFRLIPDLKELGELIYKYRYYRNVRFHNQQKYGKNYFQGQPIYLIEPVFAKDKYSKKIEMINYFYNIKDKNVKYQYEAIFTNYKTAILAWKKFRNSYLNYNLPAKPKLIVYNLEDFIKACENNNQITNRNIVFIPSQESYLSIKNNIQAKSQFNILYTLSTKLLYLQIMTKRIIWSLTSRQPITW
uniref:Uncharacterized protein n=1 Tax=Schimmelmannia schousboei TaxID=173468 RepID=A0A1C9C8P8_9FLOR|nr:hypothetical protein Schim_070 [Schimmelmannia schousboei]AOM64751.1 hypothetical protein Schim_070 [Schimmelmannia schousboei]